MERKEYSAGAVKLSYWFIEFRKVVELLHEGKNAEQIKSLALNENLFAARLLSEPIRFIILSQAASGL